MLCGHVTNNHLLLGCADSSLLLLNRDGGSLELSHPKTSNKISSEHLVDVSKVHLKGDWLEDSLECSVKNGLVDGSCFVLK